MLTLIQQLKYIHPSVFKKIHIFTHYSEKVLEPKTGFNTEYLGSVQKTSCPHKPQHSLTAGF